MIVPVIRIIDKTTTLAAKDAAELRAVLQIYVDECFCPVWGARADIVLPGQRRKKATDWEMLLTDTPDAADALGYHDVTADGQPLLKVFCKTTQEAGESISVTASHEVAEALIDPTCAICVYGPRGAVYAYEVCDAVQGNTFEIEGHEVSDFVYPDWFNEFDKAGPFSHLRTIKKPFQIDRGGYMPVMVKGRWTQIFGSDNAQRTYLRREHLRSPLRGDNSPWKKSKRRAA